MIFFVVVPWCICTGMTYTFISVLSRPNRIAAFSCFLGSTLSHIIFTHFQSIDICYNFSYFSPWDLHTLCILIGIHHWYDNFSYLAIFQKYCWRTSQAHFVTSINIPVRYREYYRCPKQKFKDLGWINISTVDPLVFPWALFTGVATGVYKFYIINAPGVVSYQTYPMHFPGSMHTSTPLFHIIDTLAGSHFINHNPLKDIYILPLCHCPALTSEFPSQGQRTWGMHNYLQHLLEPSILHSGQFQYFHHGRCYE